MFFDDFEPDTGYYRYFPAEQYPARSGWPRLLGTILFGLLAVLYACT